jgi:hypothetical protein
LGDNVEGEVENVGVVKNSLGKEIEKCLVKTISKWRFPKPIIRKYVSHTFNFKHKADNEEEGKQKEQKDQEGQKEQK